MTEFVEGAHSMPRLRHCFLSLNFIVVMIAAFGAMSAAAAESDDSSNDKQIAQLIESLGASNYSTRVEAEFALRNLGVKALDQLSEARRHPNKQIASVAKYLLNSSSTVWFYQDDNFRVRELLEDYGTESPLGRDTILHQLSELQDDQGIGALARIARYEYNGDLSKRAALKLLTMSEFYVSAEELASRWTTIGEISAKGSNTASRWLSHYADMYKRSLAQHTERYRQDFGNITQDLVLPKPFADHDYKSMPLGIVKLSSCFVRLVTADDEMKWWRDQIDQEMKMLQAPSEDTSISVVESLCRLGAEVSLRCDRKNDAIEIATKLKELASLVGTSSSELDRVHWALDFGMPTVAIEMVKVAETRGNPDNRGLVNGQIFGIEVQIPNSRMLKYALAEAYFWQGKNAEADQKAKEALETTDFSGAAPTVAASILHNRMMDSWAGNEYLDAMKHDDQYSLIVATLYISFLQEIGNYQKAMEHCEKILARAESDPTYRDSLKEIFRGGVGDYGVENIRAMMLYSKGYLQKQRGEFDAAKPNLREAFKKSPENVDALILMYQMGGDEAYQKDLQGMIDVALERLKSAAKNYEAEWRAAPPDVYERASHSFSNSLNTYAWLLCSVNRDLETALQTSIISNKLHLHSAEYTDTLARCYYVMGDLDNAIYWQERAVTLKPGQHQLTLTLFEYRQAAAKASK